jgi:hypothetical protein
MGREFRRHGGGYKLIVQISVGNLCCCPCKLKYKDKKQRFPVYAMKAYTRVEEQVYTFLVSALYGGENPTALPQR